MRAVVRTLLATLVLGDEAARRLFAGGPVVAPAPQLGLRGVPAVQTVQQISPDMRVSFDAQPASPQTSGASASLVEVTAFPAAVMAAGIGLILYGLRSGSRPASTNGTELGLIQHAVAAPTVPARAALVMSADQSAELDEEAAAEAICEESGCEDTEERLKQDMARKEAEVKDMKAEKKIPGVSQMANDNSGRYRAFTNKMEKETAEKLDREGKKKKISKAHRRSVEGKESMQEEALDVDEEDDLQAA